MADILHRFESLGDFLDYVEPNHLPKLGNYSRRKDQEAVTFTGIASFEGAMKFARNGGWKPEGVNTDEMAESIRQNVRELTDRVKVKVYDQTGKKFDVNRYTAGDPNCMVSRRRRNRNVPTKLATIVINSGASASDKAKDLLRRAAAVYVLVDLLLETGVNAEIWVGCNSRPMYGSKDNFQHMVKVKGAEDFLDIDSLAFVLGHPAFQRRLMFSAKEQASAADRKKWGITDPGYYGVPMELAADEFEPTAYVAKFNPSERYDAKWVIARLAECGVEFETED